MIAADEAADLGSTADVGGRSSGRWCLFGRVARRRWEWLAYYQRSAGWYAEIAEPASHDPLLFATFVVGPPLGSAEPAD